MKRTQILDSEVNLSEDFLSEDTEILGVKVSDKIGFNMKMSSFHVFGSKESRLIDESVEPKWRSFKNFGCSNEIQESSPPMTCEKRPACLPRSFKIRSYPRRRRCKKEIIALLRKPANIRQRSQFAKLYESRQDGPFPGLQIAENIWNKEEFFTFGDDN
ncbi:unnamed protein product [Moneuplotes crassus]|uniref:Uncharacterized protein n=1 Tax=Euplotes crassus TaxID=5936 RepID=A0AAD1Y9W1_EUPCR|nr:unnamed protein product [Moneuplotes crassus]